MFFQFIKEIYCQNINKLKILTRIIKKYRKVKVLGVGYNVNLTMVSRLYNRIGPNMSSFL